MARKDLITGALIICVWIVGFCCNSIDSGDEGIGLTVKHGGDGFTHLDLSNWESQHKLGTISLKLMDNHNSDGHMSGNVNEKLLNIFQSNSRPASTKIIRKTVVKSSKPSPGNDVYRFPNRNGYLNRRLNFLNSRTRARKTSNIRNNRIAQRTTSLSNQAPVLSRTMVQNSRTSSNVPQRNISQKVSNMFMNNNFRTLATNRQEKIPYKKVTTDTRNDFYKPIYGAVKSITSNDTFKSNQNQQKHNTLTQISQHTTNNQYRTLNQFTKNWIKITVHNIHLLRNPNVNIVKVGENIYVKSKIPAEEAQQTNNVNRVPIQPKSMPTPTINQKIPPKQNTITSRTVNNPNIIPKLERVKNVFNKPVLGTETLNISTKTNRNLITVNTLQKPKITTEPVNTPVRTVTNPVRSFFIRTPSGKLIQVKTTSKSTHNRQANNPSETSKILNNNRRTNVVAANVLTNSLSSKIPMPDRLISETKNTPNQTKPNLNTAVNVVTTNYTSVNKQLPTVSNLKTNIKKITNIHNQNTQITEKINRSPEINITQSIKNSSNVQIASKNQIISVQVPASMTNLVVEKTKTSKPTPSTISISSHNVVNTIVDKTAPANRNSLTLNIKAVKLNNSALPTKRNPTNTNPVSTTTFNHAKDLNKHVITKPDPTMNTNKPNSPPQAPPVQIIPTNNLPVNNILFDPSVTKNALPDPVVTQNFPFDSVSIKNNVQVDPVVTNTVPVKPVMSSNVSVDPVTMNYVPAKTVLTSNGPIDPFVKNNLPIDPVVANNFIIDPVATNNVPNDPLLTNNIAVDSVVYKSVPVPYNVSVDPAVTSNVPTNPVVQNNVPSTPVLVNTIPVDPVITNEVPFNPSVANSVPVRPLAANSIPVVSVWTNNVPKDPLQTNNIRVDAVVTNNVPVVSALPNNVQVEPNVTYNFPVEPVATNNIPVDLAATNNVQVSTVATNISAFDPAPVQQVVTKNVQIDPVVYNNGLVNSVVTRNGSVTVSPAVTNNVPVDPVVANNVPVVPVVRDHVPVDPVVTNYVPVDLTVTNHVPVDLTVTNHVPVDPIVTNNVPVQSMVSNNVPVGPVVTNHVPVDHVATNHVPVDPIVTNNVPVQSVVSNNFQVDPVGTNNYQTDLLVTNNAPVDPVVTNHVPVDPVVTNHVSVDPVATNHVPVDLVGTNHVTVDPVGTNHVPVDPVMTNYVPIEPVVKNNVPVDPALTNHVPVDPVVTNHVPVNPIVTNHVPVDPVVTNNVPVDPVVTNHVPVDLALTNHVPVDPVVTNNVPVQSVVSNNVQIDPVGTNNYQTNRVVTNNVPVDPVVTNHVPVDLVGTNHVPVDPVVTNHVPVDPVVTNHVPVDTFVTNNVPVDPVMTNHVSVNPVMTNLVPVDPAMTNHVPVDTFVTKNVLVDPVMINHVPVNPLITNNVPIEPVVTNNVPVGPAVTNHVRVDHVVTNHAPVEPVVTNHVPVDPVVTNNVLAVTNHVPVNPVVTNNVLADPVVTNNVLADPVATNHVPVDPVATNHVPVDPVVTNHVPVDPVVTNSVPVFPIQPNNVKVVDPVLPLEITNKTSVSYTDPGDPRKLDNSFVLPTPDVPFTQRQRDQLLALNTVADIVNNTTVNGSISPPENQQSSVAVQPNVNQPPTATYPIERGPIEAPTKVKQQLVSPSQTTFNSLKPDHASKISMLSNTSKVVLSPNSTSRHINTTHTTYINKFNTVTNSPLADVFSVGQGKVFNPAALTVKASHSSVSNNQVTTSHNNHSELFLQQHHNSSVPTVITTHNMERSKLNVSNHNSTRFLDAVAHTPVNSVTNTSSLNSNILDSLLKQGHQLDYILKHTRDVPVWHSYTLSNGSVLTWITIDANSSTSQQVLDQTSNNRATISTGSALGQIPTGIDPAKPTEIFYHPTNTQPVAKATGKSQASTAQVGEQTVFNETGLLIDPDLIHLEPNHYANTSTAINNKTADNTTFSSNIVETPNEENIPTEAGIELVKEVGIVADQGPLLSSSLVDPPKQITEMVSSKSGQAAIKVQEYSTAIDHNKFSTPEVKNLNSQQNAGELITILENLIQRHPTTRHKNTYTSAEIKDFSKSIPERSLFNPADPNGSTTSPSVSTTVVPAISTDQNIHSTPTSNKLLHIDPVGRNTQTSISYNEPPLNITLGKADSVSKPTTQPPTSNSFNSKDLAELRNILESNGIKTAKELNKLLMNKGETDSRQQLNSIAEHFTKTDNKCPSDKPCLWCRSSPAWSYVDGMSGWCMRNCKTQSCVHSRCKCKCVNADEFSTLLQTIASSDLRGK